MIWDSSNSIQSNSAYTNGLKKQLRIFFIYFSLFVVGYYILRANSEKGAFFQLQLQLSNYLVFVIVLHLVLAFLFWRESFLLFFKDFFSTPWSAYNLALFRIGFFMMLIGLYWYQFQNAAILTLGAPEIIPLPFTSWYLPFIPFDYTVYKTLYHAGILVAMLCCLGIGYRYIAWLNILFSFYLIGVPMFLGKLFFMQLWFWGSCFMAFAPASDVLSVDVLIGNLSGNRIKHKASAKYGIALKFIWLHLGIIYFFSAIWKLMHTGLEWALGDTMVNQVQLEWLQNYYTIPSFRLDHISGLSHIGGVYTIIVELTIPFLILSNRYRILAILCGLSIHWFAWYFMNLAMGDLQFMYFSFINVSAFMKYNSNTISESTFVLDYKAKAVLYIGIFFFVTNSVCGAFNIESWPFSSYPTHNSNVGYTFKRIEFEVPQDHLTRFSIDSIGLKNNFRKDNYYPQSDAAISAYERKDTVGARKYIEMLWKNWQVNNKELKQYEHPIAWIIETPVNPEKWNQIILKRQFVY